MMATRWATREQPIEVTRRLRALYAVVGQQERLLIGTARMAQYLASLAFFPAGGRAGVWASKWTVQRWLRRLGVPTLDYHVNKDLARELNLLPGRYVATTNFVLLGALLEAGRWPLSRGGTDGADAPTRAPGPPLPPAASRFTRESWRRFGRPGKRATG